MFHIISRNACSETTLIAHFLLKYSKVEQIFIDNSTSVEQRLLNVLNSWYDSNPANVTTWKLLKSVLKFLNKIGLIRKLEENESKYQR